VLFRLSTRVDSLTLALTSTNLDVLTNTRSLSRNVTDLTKRTAGISDTLLSAQQNINAVKTQVGGVEQSVGTISNTVGNIEKLSQIDPELLKKYSRVYFLNENYVPKHLTLVPDDYTYSTTRQEQFGTEAWPYLKNLFDAAKADGVTLYVKSGYRSFYEQKALKSVYSVTYGAGTANSFSADQGYSEHQLGTALDFITTGLNGNLTEAFDKTAAYIWLTNNAYKYGFVLSYPKNNSYYVYEPWHWRFVGVKLSTYLHNNNLHFYDIDQRTIDTYLINIFD
jgi:D-alanyl-D-alanine carboxypeptidase